MREHVCSLPDGELLKYASGSPSIYNPDAIEVARQEAARRGLEIPAPSEPTAEEARPAPDCEGIIEGHRPCVRCGYDLMALDASSRCPECGLAIAWSASDNLLRYADRRWLRRVALGLRVMFCAGLLGFLCALPAMLVVISDLFSMEFLWQLRQVSRFVQLCAAIGVLLFTAKEPQAVSSRERIRQPLRWLVTANLVLMACDAIESVGGDIAPNLDLARSYGSQVMFWFTALTLFLQLRYAAGLAQRTESQQAQKWLSKLQWALPAVILSNQLLGEVLQYLLLTGTWVPEPWMPLLLSPVLLALAVALLLTWLRLGQALRAELLHQIQPQAVAVVPII